MKTVLKSYAVAYPNAIRVSKGTVVRVVKEETKPEWLGWYWCEDDAGQTGWISREYLEVTSSGPIVGSTAVLKRDYDAKEAAVTAGERVEVLREERGWAWVRKTNGDEGWVPVEHLI